MSDAERIVYVQEILAEARLVSRSIANSDVLTYFIEMAVMEADDTAREIDKRK